MYEVYFDLVLLDSNIERGLTFSSLLFLLLSKYPLCCYVVLMLVLILGVNMAYIQIILTCFNIVRILWFNLLKRLRKNVLQRRIETTYFPV